MKKYDKTNKQPEGFMEVREEFVPYGIKQLDSKDRISLGGKLKKIINGKMDSDGVQLFVGRGGDLLLRPAVSIPGNEAWIYRKPGVIDALREGLKQAGEGKTKRVDNLEDYLKKL